ncbi:MAG: 2,3-diphosphoglycerate-dependent phosphoglycerate mutase [Candidatus Staskawiczbacteria bacterium]|nr:2,3-diphosphoglycerate-dependent phosphoglycerate mutase [Candidatus Staskawiczbacteria bacterium]
MAKLFLQRHLKSQWNLENKFTGWTDVPLCQEGVESAKTAAEKLVDLKIDKVYTSPLIRNRETVSLILKNLGKEKLPVIFDKALDERNYGELQGLNKDEVRKQYGQEQVRLWRRSFDIAPPGGESLKDVCKRTIPFYKKYIEKDLKAGKNVLVVASHNSLRAIVKYVEKISDEKIIDLELPFGALVKYQFDNNQYNKI